MGNQIEHPSFESIALSHDTFRAICSFNRIFCHGLPGWAAGPFRPASPAGRLPPGRLANHRCPAQGRRKLALANIPIASWMPATLSAARQAIFFGTVNWFATASADWRPR